MIWLCCHLWHCSLRTYFCSPIDMRQSSSRWSQLITPLPAFIKSITAMSWLQTRQGDEHGKSCLGLQKQKSFIKESPPSTSGYPINKLQSKVGSEVAVDVHTLGVGGGAIPRKLQSPECAGWAGTDDERETDIDLAKTRAVGQLVNPRRASSTEWTPLEKSLDYWQQEHSRPRPIREDERRAPKVRYNDTGSLEEYKKLWRLRTSLEVAEGRRGIVATFGGPNRRRASASAAFAPSIAEQHLHSQSSPDLSPDVHTSGSHTTSFESNTERLNDENVGGKVSAQVGTQVGAHSYEARKQQYRNMLSWRAQPTTPTTTSRSLRYPNTRQAPIEMHSFDSVDTQSTATTDNEQKEPRAKSFEEKPYHTEYTGDYKQQHQRQQPYHHRQHPRYQLVQQRTDSGYRSMDYPSHIPVTRIMYNSYDMRKYSIPSVGESVEEASEGEFASIEVEDEGIAELKYPGRRAAQYSASKKRRDFGRMNDCTRDYSVDEKSDALFKEFSRCDTPPNLGLQKRRTSHQRHHHQHSKLNLRADEDVSFSAVPIIRVAQEPDQDQSHKL